MCEPLDNDNMGISVFVFYTRRPEVTPEDFKSHLEDVHLPIIKEVFEDHQPTAYSIQYVVPWKKKRKEKRDEHALT